MFKYTVIKNIPLPIIKDTFWTIDTPISTEIKLLLPRDIDLQDKNLVNANLISASNVSISSGLTTSTILAPSSEPLKMYVYNNDLEIVATRNNVQNSINVYDSLTNLTSEKYWEIKIPDIGIGQALQNLSSLYTGASNIHFNVEYTGDVGKYIVAKKLDGLTNDQTAKFLYFQTGLSPSLNRPATLIFATSYDRVLDDNTTVAAKPILKLAGYDLDENLRTIVITETFRNYALSGGVIPVLPLITEEQVSQIGTNTTAIETKQPLLIAGDNITISPTNEISATGNNYWKIDTNNKIFQNDPNLFGVATTSLQSTYENIGRVGKTFIARSIGNYTKDQNASFLKFLTGFSTETTTPHYVTDIYTQSFSVIQDDSTFLSVFPILKFKGYDIDENLITLYLTEILRNYNVTAGEIPVLPLITEAQVTQIETNKTAIATKQNTLTAGANITISPTNEISATGGDTLWEFVGNKVQLVTPKSLVMQTQHIEDVSSINFVGGAAIGYNPGTGLSEGTEPGIIIFDVAHSKIINLGSALKNFVGSSYDTPIIPAITEQDIANIQTNYNLVKDINKGILFTKLSLPNADTPVQLLTEDRLFVPTTTFTGYTFNAATSSITLPVGYRYRFELFDTGTTGGNRAAEWTITVTQNGVTETFTTDGSSTKTIIITDPNNIVTATYGTNLVAYGGHDINYNIIVLGLIDTTQKIISLTNS